MVVLYSRSHTIIKKLSIILEGIFFHSMVPLKMWVLMFLHQTFVRSVFLGTLLFHLSFYIFVPPTYNFTKMGEKMLAVNDYEPKFSSSYSSC